MKRILIDTNIYTAFKRNVSEVTDTLRRVDYIGMNTVVLGELHGGFKGGSREKQNILELERFLDSPRVHVLLIDETTAEYYGQIYGRLHQKGNPIPTNDLWIAASAFQHSLALYTLDSHFSKVDGIILK
ncbi:MAG: type II toxin-antitoxin system VapC family toxin [Thermodesulfobacteriota bacterium]